MMEKNIGTADRVARIIIGLILLALGYMYGSWWGIIGLIPLLTGLIGWCALYKILGISTIKK